jgi:hypothetical protein
MAFAAPDPYDEEVAIRTARGSGFLKFTPVGRGLPIEYRQWAIVSDGGNMLQ